MSGESEVKQIYAEMYVKTTWRISDVYTYTHREKEIYTDVYRREGRVLRGYKNNTDHWETAEKFNTK